MRQVLTLVTIVLAGVSLSAQERFGPTDRELALDADLIVRGEVVERIVLRHGDDIVTRSTISITSTLRGISPLETIHVDILGGVVDGHGLVVPGEAEMAIGDRVLLFLRRDGDRYRPLYGSAGVFHVSASRKGEIVWRRGESRQLYGARFQRWIRDAALGRPALEDYEMRATDRELEVAPMAVPSSYVIRRSGTSGAGTAEMPLRWASFLSGITFNIRGTQIGASSDGLASVTAGFSAWNEHVTSNVDFQVGGTTSASAAEDCLNTVQLGDPDGVIDGSYAESSFAPVANAMSTTRGSAAAVLLASGKVLIAGGYGTDGCSVAPCTTTTQSSAELFDPASDSFTATNGDLISARAGHEAILLNDDTVLVAGGWNATGTELSSGELYDPLSGMFSELGNSMSVARGSYFTMTDLGSTASGRILIAGGTSGAVATNKADIYNPTTSGFSATGNMTSARHGHAAAWMDSELKVLIVGGVDGSGTTLTSAELFEWDFIGSTGSFTATGAMNVARQQATATRTNDGLVLVVGGKNGTMSAIGSAELFDPSAGSGVGAFESTVGDLNVARYGHTATLLSNGTVLITGGLDASGNVVQVAEIYDPETRTFITLTEQLGTARREHVAVHLSGREVLIAGGIDSSAGYLSAPELFSFPQSFLFGQVKLWIVDEARTTNLGCANDPVSQHAFSEETFFSIAEADIIVQDGFSGAGLTNGGYDQVLTYLTGQALGLRNVHEPAIMNPSFDFASAPYGATLQPYDQEAASFVYPLCPVINTHPQSLQVTEGEQVTLSVDATAGGTVSYQWYAEVPGTTPTFEPVGFNQPSYTFTAVIPDRDFYVSVTNECGSTDSGLAIVDVLVRGDLNGDNDVNSADLDLLIAFHYAGGAMPAGDPDIDNDGQISTLDIFALIWRMYNPAS